MAKQPSKGRKAEAEEAAQDAIIVESPETEPDVAEKPEPEALNDDAAPAPSEFDESPVQAEGESLIMTDPQLASDGEPEMSAEDIRAQTEAQAPAPQPVVTSQKKASVVPLVFGGLIAGLVGYAVGYAQWIGQSDLAAAYEARISALEERVSNLPPPVDLSELEQKVAATAPALASLDERLTTVERQPSGDGTLPETALAAYQADIDALRAEIADQQAAMQAIAADTASRLEATRAEAQSIEANAVDAARAATARAALARVQAALESGAPIAATLSELGDTLDAPLPEALNVVAEGAPTLAALQESFPEFARTALATARLEGEDGENTGGLTAFFRNQFEVRSVEPQEGNSVDAILSRAEAALRAGRLSDSLAEIATLPDVSRGAMAEWTEQASARAAALDAADTLATSLNDN